MELTRGAATDLAPRVGGTGSVTGAPGQLPTAPALQPSSERVEELIVPALVCASGRTDVIEAFG